MQYSGDDMKFEFDNNMPIYIQLVEQLKNNIISGTLSVGERLPSVRELALQTKVNPNTMQKALTELEDLGLVYTDRTNGKYVTNDVSLISKYKEKQKEKLTIEYLNSMYNIGLNKEDILDYLNRLGE